jgi:hypothetical protein
VKRWKKIKAGVKKKLRTKGEAFLKNKRLLFHLTFNFDYFIFNFSQTIKPNSFFTKSRTNSYHKTPKTNMKQIIKLNH